MKNRKSKSRPCQKSSTITPVVTKLDYKSRREFDLFEDNVVINISKAELHTYTTYSYNSITHRSIHIYGNVSVLRDREEECVIKSFTGLGIKLSNHTGNRRINHIHKSEYNQAISNRIESIGNSLTYYNPLLCIKTVEKMSNIHYKLSTAGIGDLLNRYGVIRSDWYHIFNIQDFVAKSTDNSIMASIGSYLSDNVSDGDWEIVLPEQASIIIECVSRISRMVSSNDIASPLIRPKHRLIDALDSRDIELIMQFVIMRYDNHDGMRSILPLIIIVLTERELEELVASCSKFLRSTIEAVL